MKTNLITILNHASYYDYDNGFNWYNEAREFCLMVSKETGHSYMVTCAVLAALSPRNKWERNKIDCFELCKGNDSHKFGTFNANVRKAKSILSLTKYQDVINALNGKKIIAFFDNIFDENSERVTVDVWMLLAYHGMRLAESERPNVTQKLYDEIEDAVIELARENNLRPYEAQAIIWTTFRGAK